MYGINRYTKQVVSFINISIVIRYRWIDIIKGLKDKNADFVDKKVHFGRHTQFKKLFFNCIRNIQIHKDSKEINCKNITKLTFSFYRG